MQPRDPEAGVGPKPPSVPARTGAPSAMPTPSPPHDAITPSPHLTGLATSAPQKQGGRIRSRRARLWFALSAGIVALLCLGGVGVVVALYDDATQIKRTDPNVVLVNFLGAYLSDRDDEEAKLYVCKSAVDLSRLSVFREDVKKVERKYSVGVMITWRNLRVEVSGNHAAAAVDIVRTISGGAEETFDPWKFEMLDEGGWRVCSAIPGV